jgi:paraquat-inducible protein B
MRATLESGNLLTGSQLISFDYYPDAEPAEMGQFEQYTTIPTIETGVGRLENQVSDLLKKLNALPLEQTVAGTNKAIDRVDAALASLTTALDSVNAMLQSDDTKALPGELAATLQELRSVLDGLSADAEPYQNLNASLKSIDATLDNLRSLTRQLSEKPNAMIFPARPEKDPIPEASRR